MVTTVNNSASPATAPSGVTPSGASAPSSAPVSAGAIGGGFVPTALFELSMPVAVAGASGLRAPLNPEDAGALLLLAEAALDTTSGRNRAASLEARFGAAGGALASVGAQLSASQTTLKAAQDALATAQAKQATDKGKQADAKQTFDAATTAVTDLQTRIAAVEAAGTDASQLDLQLVTARQSQSTAHDRLAAADTAVDDDDKAVTDGTAAATKAQSDLSDQAGLAAAALSQIATGLRLDVGRDTGQANHAAQRRDIAYGDVGDTAKHFREGDVARGRRDEAASRRRAEVATEPREDTPQDASGGAELAGHLAAALRAAVPVLRNFAASPLPAVPQTAAMEAGGRLRLSL